MDFDIGPPELLASMAANSFSRYRFTSDIDGEAIISAAARIVAGAYPHSTFILQVRPRMSAVRRIHGVCRTGVHGRTADSWPGRRPKADLERALLVLGRVRRDAHDVRARTHNKRSDRVE